MHLCNVNFRGSLGNLHDAVVAQAGEGMLEHSRHHLAACVVASTHPTLVHDLVRAQEVVTANALQKEKRFCRTISSVWEGGVRTEGWREIYWPQTNFPPALTPEAEEMAQGGKALAVQA